MNNKYKKAIDLFDKANSDDPNVELWKGQEYPKELLYAMRMTNKLNHFLPNASETVRLAVRCQHICRWEIPRNSYEMTRKGYLIWRKDLSQFHAGKASQILREVGYDDDVINKVIFLLLKKQLKLDEETQLLEDVICLVFLEYYFDGFSKKHTEDKLIDIIQKTWPKMSNKGKESALQLNFSEALATLIQKSLVKKL